MSAVDRDAHLKREWRSVDLFLPLRAVLPSASRGTAEATPGTGDRSRSQPARARTSGRRAARIRSRFRRPAMRETPVVAALQRPKTHPPASAQAVSWLSSGPSLISDRPGGPRRRIQLTRTDRGRDGEVCDASVAVIPLLFPASAVAMPQ